MVNRCQYLKTASVCIQNTSISRCYKSTAMPLDSYGRQVAAFKKCQRLYTKHQHFKNTSISDIRSRPPCPLTVTVDRCQHLENASVRIQNTSISRRYKLTAMSLDSHGRQVPAFKNASVHIQNTHILKAPAFPDVTSQLLCLLTVTVDRWRHLKNVSVRIQNNSIFRCYKSTTMSLDSHVQQVPAFKKTPVFKYKTPEFVYWIPAFPDVTSQPLCQLTVKVNRCQHLKNASVHMKNTNILKTSSFPDVTGRPICPLTVMVDRCQHIKNTSVRIKITYILKTPAFPDVTSRPACHLTITVDRCQHLKSTSDHIWNTSISRRYKLTTVSLDSHSQHVPALKRNASVRIQNTSISRRYKSSAMSLDSRSGQVRAFKKRQCSYTKHQHFPMLQINCYVHWQPQSTGASI